MNIKLMKFLDTIIGRLAVQAIPKPEFRSVPSAISSILFIRPGGIGDAVLLIPAIQAARKKFPSAKIMVLAERRNASVFQLCPELTGVLLYDRPSEFVAALRQEYDVVIDSEQWHRLSAVMARLTSAAMLVVTPPMNAPVCSPIRLTIHTTITRRKVSLTC